MKARDIMTSNPEVLTPSDTVKQAAQLMRDRDVGLIPVVGDRKEMRLQGVITDRDITVRAVAEGDGAERRIGDIMSGDAIARVQPADSIDDVARTMQEWQVRRIPVVDEEDRLVGIIAQADLARQTRDRGRVAETVADISKPTRTDRRAPVTR